MNLIFDLDNTLCDCSVYYVKKQNEFAEYQSQRTGHTAEFCLNLLKRIDLTFTDVPDGFAKDRFPRAFAAASSVIDIMMGRPIDESAAEISWHIGDSVFAEPYKLYDGVYDMLRSYKHAGHEIFIWTKGDFHIQQNKISRNKLDYIVDSNKIYITLQKTEEGLQRILKDHDLKISDTFVIGDSRRDEISAAIKSRVSAVWISEPSNQWEYETDVLVDRTCAYFVIPSVCDLPKILPIY